MRKFKLLKSDKTYQQGKGSKKRKEALSKVILPISKDANESFDEFFKKATLRKK